MKTTKILSVFLLAIPFGGLAQQQNFTIKGSMKPSAEATTACIYYVTEGKPVLDTMAVINGKFTLKGQVPYALKGTVFVRFSKPPYAAVFKDPAHLDQIDVYLENGTITVSTPDSLKYAEIGGTPLNKDYRELVKLLTPFEVEEAALDIAKRRAEDYSQYMPAVKAAYAEMASRKNPVQEAFISSHLHSLVGMELLTKAIDPAFNLVKAQSYFNKFPKELRASLSGKTYANLFNVAVGCQAPDFVSKNTNGEEVSLSSYRGKYVMLDFWASWCMPCRAQNPHVKKMSAKYKQDKFAVLGVSLDQSKEWWLKAIKMDGITWDQVCDLKGFKSNSSQLYGITAVPTTFLIDPSGKIIAKNLHGAELEAKLAEVMPESKSK